MLAVRVGTKKGRTAAASMDGNWACRPHSRIILKLKILYYGILADLRLCNAPCVGCYIVILIILFQFTLLLTAATLPQGT
jgi:hypothetical protein